MNNAPLAREPSRFTISESVDAENNCIDISSLGKDVKDALKPFDTNGDGRIDIHEIALAGMIHQHLKGAYALLQKAFAGVVIVLLILGVTLASLSYVFAESAQETNDRPLGGWRCRRLQGHARSRGRGGQVELRAPVGTLAYLPDRVPPHVTDVSFKSGDGTTTYHRKVMGVDVVPRKSVKVQTAQGDLLSWDGEDDGGHVLRVSMADGSEWNNSAACDECSAGNVFADEEVRDALSEFHEDLGLSLESRRLIPITEKVSIEGVEVYS